MRIALVLFVCLVVTPLDGVTTPSKNREETLYFYSAMRSGTHWMFYILKHFTKRPLTVFVQDGTARKTDPYKQGTVDTKPFIHHGHYYLSHRSPLFDYGPACVNRDRILVIVRNPIECTLRQAKSIGFTIEETVNWILSPTFALYANLRYFDKWPENKRCLVYYEELLLHPAKVLRKLLGFLGESRALLSGFLRDIERHKSICLNHYDARSKSYSKGEDLFYHSNLLSTEELAQLRQVFMEKDPYIWQTYLSHY